MGIFQLCLRCFSAWKEAKTDPLILYITKDSCNIIGSKYCKNRGGISKSLN